VGAVNLSEALLKHHLMRAERGEIKNVIHNCHVIGLHSIMLHDEPGNRVRLFVAGKNHRLWGTPMPLAIHAHHCDVVLVGVSGTVNNLRYELGGAGAIRTREYRYESGVTGTVSLTPTGQEVSLTQVDLRPVTSGVSASMGASELHTVKVDRYHAASWFVIEGAEDPEYDSLCYTNNPSFDPSQLYVRGSSAAAASLLAGLT
jgi:hypothetical protein